MTVFVAFVLLAKTPMFGKPIITPIAPEVYTSLESCEDALNHALTVYKSKGFIIHVGECRVAVVNK